MFSSHNCHTIAFPIFSAAYEAWYQQKYIPCSGLICITSTCKTRDGLLIHTLELASSCIQCVWTMCVAAEHLDFPFNFLKLQTQYGTEIHNFRLSQIRLRCMDNVAESDNHVDPRTTYHKLICNKVTIRNRNTQFQAISDTMPHTYG